ncbi:MAG TPA: BMP family ABC transporter substrate-binding protein, partial [Oceanithermus sp.]|nr:BMP family ABC transporter substrate-binding protein [Oceanithermus sp.]
MRKVWLAAVLVLGALAFGQQEVKAGWIYVGPIGDYGWTHAHDVGRKEAEAAFPWLKTSYVESVPEGQAGSYI